MGGVRCSSMQYAIVHTQQGWLQVRKLPRVNAQEHLRLQAARLDGAAGGSSRKAAAQDAAAADAVLGDDRFAALFEDDEFAIDEGSRTYRELHPNARALPLGCSIVSWY